MKSYLIIFITIIVAIKLVNSEDCKGCVALDTLSFDKVINKFKASLVKFDVAFPYGDKHDEYGKVALSTKDTEDLLVAVVGVKDFGNKDNSDLAQRFKVEKADFPAVLLFTQGQTEPYKLLTGASDDFTADNIKRLVRAKTGIYIGLPGCVEQLDKLVDEFKTSEGKDRQEILNKAKALAETLSDQHQTAAKIYIKLMEKVIDKGDNFVQTEQNRIDGILKGKLSDEKKRTIEERKNILQSFAFKDEL
ncbi:protein windbeutel [Chelonus insularis]|uniref:protein windbeutel n=1 Tax=Chelonus insularis TaxID=460826 RepID=UPI00158B0728|nr:protein windbeutel [Chelonus insularis]